MLKRYYTPFGQDLTQRYSINISQYKKRISINYTEDKLQIHLGNIPTHLKEISTDTIQTSTEEARSFYLYQIDSILYTNRDFLPEGKLFSTPIIIHFFHSNKYIELKQRVFLVQLGLRVVLHTVKYNMYDVHIIHYGCIIFIIYANPSLNISHTIEQKSVSSSW